MTSASSIYGETVDATFEVDIEGDAAPSTTIDKLHEGAFEVIQPKGAGHRVGLDAMLLGASLPANSSGLLADLGAGSGAAGLAALNLYRELDLLSVELNQIMFDLLLKTAKLPGNAKFQNRMTALQADVTKTGKDRAEQGLVEASVDHLIMNPPYNTYSYRPPADKIKKEAHVLGEGGLDAWFRTASAMLRHGGTCSTIYRAENIAAVIACCQGRFGGLEILPIHSRADEAAKRILVRGIRGSRAPLAILPGFVVHNDDGTYTEKASRIFKGESLLEF